MLATAGIAWQPVWDKYQTGNSIDYKQSSITRPPGGIAPGATEFFPFLLSITSIQIIL